MKAREGFRVPRAFATAQALVGRGNAGPELSAFEYANHDLDALEGDIRTRNSRANGENTRDDRAEINGGCQTRKVWASGLRNSRKGPQARAIASSKRLHS